MREPRARLQGVDEETIAEIAVPGGGRLSERERAVVDFATRFSGDHHSIDSKVWKRLRSLFTPAELAQITIFVPWFLATGRLTETLFRDADYPLEVLTHSLIEPAPTHQHDDER